MVLFVAKAKKIGNQNSSGSELRCCYLIYGTNAPFILQKIRVNEDEVENKDRGITYIIIGELYVHGLMDGEGLRDPHYTEALKFEWRDRLFLINKSRADNRGNFWRELVMNYNI